MRLLRQFAQCAVLVTAFFVTLNAQAQSVPGGAESTPEATATGQFGKGFTLRAKDDSMSLNVRARVQVQAFAETRPEDPKTPEEERPDIGFMVRRLRLALQGHVFSKDVRYYVQLGFSPRDQEPDLLVPVRDAQIIWAGWRDLNVRFGQMKVPFNRERVISSSSLALVDRSNVNAELNLDRDIGVMLQSRDLFGLGHLLRYNLGLFGGDGRNRTTPNTGLLYAARIEVAPFGKFDDDYSEADFSDSTKPRLAVGFAAAYSDSTVRARGTNGDTFKAGTADYRHGAADAIFKWRGLSLQSEVLFRRASETVLERVQSDGTLLQEYPRSAWGFMAQAGYLISGTLEPVVRYGEVRPLNASKVARDREIGGGLSYYFHKHDLKIQGDYFRLLTDEPTGVVGRDRVRVQVQVYF